MRTVKLTVMTVLSLGLLLAGPHAGFAQEAPAPTPEPAPAPQARAAYAYQVASGGSFLGVGTRDVKAERMAELKLSEQRGVEITEVDREAPAGKAGLQAGDVILEFNGNRVESVASLKRMLGETPPGRAAALGISRNGQRQTVQVELGERPRREIHSRVLVGPRAPRAPGAPPVMRVMPAVPAMVMAYRSPMHGLMVENLNQQLGEFFGVKDGNGVLVRSVEKGSPAEAAGFRAGDVIIQIQDEKVVDASDFRRALRKQKGGSTVAVRVVREKREQQLSLAVPEGHRESSLYFDFDFDFDVEEMRRELDRMRPEIERMAYALGEVSARELRKNSAEIEKAVRQATEEMERTLRQRQVEIEKEMEKVREEREKQEP